jgi:hypothetical protein
MTPEMKKAWENGDKELVKQFYNKEVLQEQLKGFYRDVHAAYAYALGSLPSEDPHIDIKAYVEELIAWLIAYNKGDLALDEAMKKDDLNSFDIEEYCNNAKVKIIASPALGSNDFPANDEDIFLVDKS